MVQTWAEKEMRNLSRMFKVGIPCPEPFVLRGHVLLMDFIGTDGWPAPLLKDVDIGEEKARELYPQCLRLTRTMFQDAKLVHGDLSEYNMLYHQGQLYFIDVSQSVEMDHPNALEFLRKDCNNVTEYFRKCNVAVLSVKQLFDFVTDPTITADNIDAYLDEAQKQAVTGQESEATNDELVAEEVFKQSFIPQRLEEVSNFEKDVRRVQSGEAVDYLRMMGLKGDLSGVSQEPEILQNEGVEDREEEEEDASSDSGSEENEEDSEKQGNTRRRDMSPNSWREHKKKLKLERREKIKEKIPKHIKKRKEKMGKERHKGKK